MVLHFLYPPLIKFFQLNLSVVLQFRHLYLHMDQLTRFADNLSYFFGEFPMQVPQKACLLDPTASTVVQLLLQRIPFQKGPLSFWLGHTKSLTLWCMIKFTLCSRGCYIPRFENRTRIPFFLSCLELQGSGRSVIL